MRSPHERTRSAAWTLKLLALTPIAVSAVLFLTIGGWGATIVALIIGAFGYLGWRRPGLVGALFLAWVPLGAFLALLGSTTLDPASQVILGFIWLAGLPLLSGLLFVAAALWRAGKAT
jgi:hypothetical protein